MNITRIDYNCQNLPTMIRFCDGSKYMSMKYDAAGRLLRRTTRVPFRDIAVSGKLQQERARVDLTTLSSGIVARNVAAASATSTAGSSSGSSAASPSLAPSTTLQGTPSSVSSSVVPAISGKVSMRTFGMTDYDYCGNVEYTNDKAVLYHSEGYVTFDKNQQPEFHYYLKDHLGNIRVVFNERDSVEQVTHYYPFGGSFADGVGSSVQDYLYSGKELTRFNALNWYNFGARWYDPTIARWNGVDNMAENYLGCSPYIYCGNNPISRIDVDGNDWYITGSGNIVYNPSVHSQEDIGSKDQERGYKYLGESWTDKEKGIQYRRDGSILFSNEKDAYNRMWYFANKHWRSKKYPAGKENSAFILSDGRVLVLPDFNNDSHTSKMYGYRWKGNELLGPYGFKEEFTAQVHTHQTGDCAPSHVVGVRDDDDFCFNMPNKAMFVLAHDGNLYGMYYSTKRHGIETFNNKPIGTITNVLKGYTSLFFTSKIIIK